MTANAACNMANRLCANFVPEPGQNIHLPLSKKKQVGVEMVGFSCQCSVLVRSGLDS